MSAAQYYVRIRGKVLGPFDLTQLRRQRDRGQLSRFHEVSEDRVTWVPASSLGELFPADGAASPPVASPAGAITRQPPRGGSGERAGAETMWHYTTPRGKQVGPVTREQLLALLDDGTVTAETLVWNPSLEDWMPLDSVPGLMPSGARGKKGGLRFSLGLASLAAAVVWACGLGSAAAVVLGVLGLREAKRKGDAAGRKMALAGLIAGAGGLALTLVVGLAGGLYWVLSPPGDHSPAVIREEYGGKVYKVEHSDAKVTIQGSGIMLANDSRRGLLATNLHVIMPGLVEEIEGKMARKMLPDNALKKRVTAEVQSTAQLNTKKAVLAAIHKDLDLALLLVEMDNARPENLSVARQDHIHDGEAAVAMGYPLGLPLNTTTGVITNHRGESGMVWTNCSISPGNSGGPLFLQRGGLLAGLNTGFIPKGQNVNSAVPAEQIVGALGEGRTDSWVWEPELREDVVRLAKMVRLNE
ncbi:MAG TPA: GYF domain-containing protein [Gemmataceae bacterium]|nr:GYF domain-containing protein [Gemmataceae bacterium]